MHFFISFWPYQTMKFTYLFHLSIQLHSSNLNNLKGHMLHGAFFSLRALVPLQIKYNIILHNGDIIA